MLPALAGLVVGLAYAAIILYWAVGGRWLLNTVGISLSQPGQARHLAALLAAWERPQPRPSPRSCRCSP
jgi:hypothetical protein